MSGGTVAYIPEHSEHIVSTLNKELLVATVRYSPIFNRAHLFYCIIRIYYRMSCNMQTLECEPHCEDENVKPLIGRTSDILTKAEFYTCYARIV